MNKQRRKEIGEVLAEIAEFGSTIEGYVNTIQSLLDQEQDYLNNMPEPFADSEKGEKAQTAIYALQDALDSLESAQASLNEASEV